jgi:C1A family cysteine protease
MLNYRELNVNPKKRKTGDCSTRALVSCIGIDYNTALDLQVQEAKKSYYDITSRQVMEKVIEKFGYYKMKQPRKLDNTKYMVKEMDRVVSKSDLQNGVIVNVARHYVALKDTNYIDIWNSGHKCVGNYYIKIK